MGTTVFPRCFTDGRRVCGIFTRYGKCAADYKFEHVLRKAAAEKCKGSHCELLLHVKEAVAEGATVGITSLRIQTISEVHNAHVKLNHLRCCSSGAFARS
ncbi:hypothetical protein M0804_013336 [Polistes exclamans]|nr:hypothetical protein M0804_013336 [Polistes exclamans]